MRDSLITGLRLIPKHSGHGNMGALRAPLTTATFSYVGHFSECHRTETSRSKDWKGFTCWFLPKESVLINKFCTAAQAPVVSAELQVRTTNLDFVDVFKEGS